jgi:hypothetical protein
MIQKTISPGTSSKEWAKRPAESADVDDKTTQTADPFAAFTEWWSEADERAYSRL